MIYQLFEAAAVRSAGEYDKAVAAIMGKVNEFTLEGWRVHSMNVLDLPGLPRTTFYFLLERAR